VPPPRGPRWQMTLLSPMRASVLSFGLFIIIGAILLWLLPSSSGKGLRFIDALFTITSGACVTGLTVIDVGKDLSLLGQLILLFWIQAGGLGIMTLSTFLLLLAGRRPTLSLRTVVEDTFTHRGAGDVRSLLLDIVKFTVVIEAMGGLVLYLRFSEMFPPLEAMYFSVFHSVSAFCNAGFSLFSRNLEDFAGDPLVNFAIAGEIVLGGLGFLVLREIKEAFRKGRLSRGCLSLHSKVVIWTTAILILCGAVLFGLMEWENTLRDLDLGARIMASLFQSVTPRTAGFNTIPIGEVANETLLLLVILMFIGGSSGSTAGGIKTGTFAILCSTALCRLRGYQEPFVFGRTISPGSVARAMSVTIVCIVIVMVGTFLLQATEVGASVDPGSRGKFLELLFEVVSAFGTVGLSTGVTPSLSDAGKIVLIIIMFTGRLGPLAVAVAASRQRIVKFRFAEEGIMVG